MVRRLIGILSNIEQVRGLIDFVRDSAMYVKITVSESLEV
jgi:hypothetical protein